MELNKDNCRQSIYLDFEGTGRTQENDCPLPHMAGLFRPNENGKAGSYEAIFFNSQWIAPKNGSSGKGSIEEFDKAINMMIDEANDKQSCIVFWSDHERGVIEKYLPELYDSFEKVGFNLLPELRSIKNRRNIELDESIDKKLNQYLKAFYPERQQISSFNPGPAEACRKIDTCSQRSRRWSNWDDKEKQYVRDLLSYNEQDCKATWLLALKYSNMKT